MHFRDFLPLIGIFGGGTVLIVALLKGLSLGKTRLKNAKSELFLLGGIIPGLLVAFGGPIWSMHLHHSATQGDFLLILFGSAWAMFWYGAFTGKDGLKYAAYRKAQTEYREQCLAAETFFWLNQATRDRDKAKAPILVANDLVQIARLHVAAGKHETAAHSFAEALTIYDQEIAGHPLLADFLSEYATTLTSLGKSADATALLKRKEALPKAKLPEFDNTSWR